MKIREAILNDYSSIAELFWQSDTYHYQNQPDIYSATDKPFRSEDYIKELIEDEKSMFYVVEESNDVVGFIYGYEESKGFLPIHKNRTYFNIDNVVISNKYQRKGYGKMLIEKIIAECKIKKYSDIILNVYSFNDKAVSLYDSLGFEEISKDMILQL